MNIELPNLNDLLEQIIQVTLSFDGRQKTIKGWLKEHRNSAFLAKKRRFSKPETRIED